MSKIVCLALPIMSTMHAALKLAKSLRKRGHDVLFAGMADCGPIVEPYGFQCVPLFTDWFPQGFMRQWLNGPMERASWKDSLQFYLDQRRLMIEHERFIDHLIRGRHREFVETIRGIAPDLILVDIELHAYWALMAYQSGIKTVYFSPILSTVEDPVVPPCNSLLEPARDVRSRFEVRLAWGRYFARRWLFHRALRLAGVPDSIMHIKELARACGYPVERLNTRTMLMPQLDLPVLIMCPEEFEFPEACHRLRVHYIEAAIDLGRREQEFPWNELERDKQLIFCSLGSVAFSQHFSQSVIDAVGREPSWQLVMNVGPTLSRAEFARVPESTILVNGAPQLGLLKHAAAMINHGGIGSVRECIYCGVPQIVYPLGFDQPGAAIRVQYHGLGVIGSFRGATADGVHALLSQVMNDERFRSRSRDMSRVFQAKEQQQLGATIIERFLAREVE